MDQSSKQGVLGGARRHFFVLFGLLFLSGAFFVSAADEMAGKNIVDDPDQDDLTTEEERLYGTDPMNRDTDGDGYSDGVEVRGGYDPLRKAPGDKIVPEEETDASAADSFGVGGENLTEQTAQEIVALIQDAQTEGGENAEISLDDLNAVAQSLASGSAEEVALPEVDMDAIKIKKESCKKLSEKKCDEKVKEDVVEYLTVISYIFANNAPTQVSGEEDVEKIFEEVESAFSLMDVKKLNSIGEMGERALDQIYDVEVPEKMIDIHVKAIRFAKYAASLKGEFSSVNVNEDPMRMIKVISKAHGLLNVAYAFVDDVNSRLADLGINEFPFEL